MISEELIDTQWDVNTSGKHYAEQNRLRINRYIVGCKCITKL